MRRRSIVAEEAGLAGLGRIRIKASEPFITWEQINVALCGAAH